MQEGGDGAKKNRKEQMTDEIRNIKDVEETRRKKRRKKSGKEDHRQEEKYLKSSVIKQQIAVI